MLRSTFVLCAWWICGAALGEEFLAGADLSHLVFFEDRGIVYRDDGRAQDALEILKRRGLTCARLRLFTSSAEQAQADPYNYTNNLDYTLPLARRVKQAGLQFLLTFHYSDSWADPGKQTKPAAWTGLSFTELEQRMYEYNSNCIAAFKTAGAMPDYVEVGNEIIGGLLWPEGRVGGSYDTPTQWSQLGRLLTAAILGIQAAASTNQPGILIHIDRGGDWAGTQWFFDHLLQQQVEFDLIGQSYYPFWHGTLDSLRACLTNTAQRYGKPVLVAETAFPWSGSTNLLGFTASTNGQVEYTIELAKIVKSLAGGRGLGIFWWGTEYVRLPGTSLAGFDRRSFFDFEGNTLPVAGVLGQLAVPIRLNASLTDRILTITWPFSGAAMSLDAAIDLSLAPTAVWAPVTNAVQTTGGLFSTTVTLEGGQRFYRLRSN